MPPSRPLRRPLTALGAAAWWLARGGVAMAQPLPHCTDDHVVIAGTFDAAWSDAITTACARFRDLPDRDPGARLSVAPAADGSGAEVRVVLADGRAALRVARVPEELARVMEALVTLPPPSPPESAIAAPDASPSAARGTHAPPLPRDARTAPAGGDAVPHDAANVADTTSVTFDVAVLATGRVLGPPAHLGIGLVASGDVDIDRGWIVGLRARADLAVFDVEESGDLASVTFGGGLELARRFSIAKAAAIDLGLGVDGLVDVPVEHGRRGSTDRDADDARGDLRARTFGKLWLSGEGMSFCGLLGFELSPVRIAGSDSLPSVGGELGLGIGWGAL